MYTKQFLYIYVFSSDTNSNQRTEAEIDKVTEPLRPAQIFCTGPPELWAGGEAEPV
jgi:hypothetical protein